MPRYYNPNNHPVVVTISEPRISVIVYPRSWLSNRLPSGAIQEIELDARIGRELVKYRMLEECPQAEPSVESSAAKDAGSERGSASVVVGESNLSSSDLARKAALETNFLKTDAPVASRKKKIALG